LTEDGEVLRLRADGVVWREVEGEVIVLDLQSGTYFAVNASAGTLWQALAGGATRPALIDTLTASWSISHEQAAGDVDAFLADCVSNDLLEP
jgi:hypothetical protein